MEFGCNRSNYIIFLTAVVLCIIGITSGFYINQRELGAAAAASEEELHEVAARSEGSEAEEELCHISVTCAWEVYRPFKRTFEYLIKNTCECPSGYVCVKVGEDLSISAYIYKCRQSISVFASDQNGNYTKSP